jgi:hypothetical protein
MADKKISELTPASLPLAGTELVPVVQAGQTRQITTSELIGEPGPIGYTGSQGIQGDQGIKGETGPGLISGGDPGDYLVKASSTEFDIAWTNRVHAKTLVETVKNINTATLTKGTPVYQVGVDDGFITVDVARADDVNKLAIGVLDQSLNTQDTGRLLIMGQLPEVNTASFSVGDKVYLASSGGYTNIAPTANDVAQQFLGVVFKADATAGTIFITGKLDPNLIKYQSGSFYGWDGIEWKIIESGGGGDSSWQIVTETTTLQSNKKYLINTSAGSYSVSLPASPAAGDSVKISDAADFNTNPLTVLRNSNTIENLEQDVLLTVGSVTYEFIFSGTTWQVVASIGGTGPQGEGAGFAQSFLLMGA